MNDENVFGGSPLDEIDYTAPAGKKDGPAGVAAPVLDDIDYVAPTSKKGGPTGVAAPVLDDMDSYTPSAARKGAPTGVTAPTLDDDMPYASYSPQPEKLVLSDEDIIKGLTPELLETFNRLPDEQKKKVLDMRRQQLGASAPEPTITAPVLDEDNYTPPPKKEEPPKPAESVSAPILDEAPEPVKYVPKFVDEDLERAKRDAAKNAVAAQLVAEPVDKKESLRMLIQLKEERRAELAAKGFKILLLDALLGIVSAVLFFLLYSGTIVGYKEDLSGLSKFANENTIYLAGAVGFCSLLLITGAGIAKSLASMVFLFFGLIQIFPGFVMIPQHSGNLAVTGALFAASLICSVATFFILCSSEAIGAYFNRNKKLPNRERDI